MTPGGSKQKGNAWERKVGTVLSLWVSNGVRVDLFARTVLSGGQFSRSEGEVGIPGDLMANHPTAFEFLSLFAVEAKHRHDIGLDKYLLDFAGSSFLAKTFDQTKRQAAAKLLVPMVVAKSNNYAAIIMLDYAVGIMARSAARRGFHYHALHSSSVLLTTFDHFTNTVKADQFIRAVKASRRVAGE
jgi:hypothetical protein